ncbi:MAG: thioesterase family protein [Syntrophales bacterium]
MDEPKTDIKSLLEAIAKVHEKMPFNRFLGLKVDYLRTDGAGFRFPMKDEFVGNPIHGILHGGVISAALDATGGITITASAVGKMLGLSYKEIARRVARMGTIDVRVDFLRPGRGTEFLSTATIMRTGKKVAVTRMELRNQDDLLIAVGTGTYIVG